jgi:hypothetical protein
MRGKGNIEPFRFLIPTPLVGSLVTHLAVRARFGQWNFELIYDPPKYP